MVTESHPWTLLKPPLRSPIAVVECIKEYIKGKVVCELGCACGDLMLEMKRYAKLVAGIEIRSDYATLAKNRGLDVLESDMFKVEIPPADVYYAWLNKGLLVELKSKIKNGLLILGADPSENEDHIIQRLNLKGEWMWVAYNEGEGKRENGIFKLFITKLNER